MKRALIYLIVLYQKTLSPDHGWPRSLHPYGFCRHAPTCSEYAKQALSRHGILRGCWLVGARIVRCNPYSPARWDPVPKV